MLPSSLRWRHILLASVIVSMAASMAIGPAVAPAPTSAVSTAPDVGGLLEVLQSEASALDDEASPSSAIDACLNALTSILTNILDYGSGWLILCYGGAELC